MINLFGRTERTPSQFIAVAATFVSLIIVATSANAAQLKEARVTQVIKDVKLLPTQAAPRPAAVTDEVRDGTAVRTGVESRAELTFTDQTLTRLGANTIFSFNEGTRVMNLGGGAMLFQVPKGAGGATIKTAAITAAITGTTGIGEFHPATAANPHPVIKWFCLEGTIHLLLTNGSGQSVELKPGQVEVTDGTSLPQPLNFDIATLVNTSLFFTSYDTPVASLPLIQLEEQKQLDLKIAGGFVYASLATFSAPTDFVDAIDQGMVAQAANQSPPPLPTTAPTPSKFGAPAVITSPDPFVITSGTTIQTDPAITTNGQTSFGKIWRGPAQDGPLSAFIFGSTSAFDTASGFDAEINGDMGGAGFKFTSLQLTGNPTISTINGVINLGLIAVNGITSGGPGGTLTFAGIRGLLLATQNGSINLGSEISFSGLRDINFYARGSGSNLTLASAISAANTIRLFSEGSTQLSGILSTINFTSFSGGDFDLATGSISAEDIFINASGDVNLNGGKFSATSANSEGNFDLSARNKISITGGLEIDRKFGGNSLGLNLSLAAGTDLTAGNSLVLKVDNSMNGNLDSGADIALDMGGNLTINGGGALTLIVGNDNGGQIGTGGNISVMTGGSLFTQGFTLIVTNFGDVFGTPGTSVGHIGTGGNIFVTTGGNLTTDFVNTFIDNRNGASITSGATISFDVGGALTTHQNAPPSAFFSSGESLFLLISNRFNTAAGGTIGSDVTISLTAASVSVGGILDAFISNRPGTIGGSAIINFGVSGNLMVQEFAEFDIDNADDIFNTGHGGTIKSNATINLSAANISTGQGLDLVIQNRGFRDPNTGVIIGPGGTIGGNATINLNTGNISGGLFAEINNQKGTIGSDATINVGAANLSVNGTFDTRIDNTAGTIQGNASMVFNTATALTSTGDQFYQLINADGGTIGGSATLDVTTKNLSSGASLFVAILNSTNDGGATGTVASNATLNFNVSGTTTVATDATFQINGSDSAASSAINFNGGTYNVGGTFEGFMDGSGTMTFNNATINADTVKAGVFGTNGVLNIGGGTLSANTELKLYAPGSKGQLNFIANVTLTSGTGTILAGATITIQPSVFVTIAGNGGPAQVFTNNANYRGFGGTNRNNGTFAGNGANNPQPLSSVPPFGPAPAPFPVSGPPRANIHPRSPSRINVTSLDRNGGDFKTSRRTTGDVIKASDSGELLSLLDRAAPGPNGKITIPASNRTSELRNSTRTNAAGRSNADRGAMNIRTASSLPASRLQR